MIFVGYTCNFLSRFVEWLLKQPVKSMVLLFTITTSLAVTTLASGLLYQIENTTTVVVLSAIFRFMQGILAYTRSMVGVDLCHSTFPEDFEWVYGFLNAAYFAGHGIAEIVGCYLFDHYGYLVPFLFATGITLVSSLMTYFVIPNTPTYLYSQEPAAKQATVIANPGSGADPTDTDKERGAAEVGSEPGVKLTPLLGLPIVAAALININYGVIQVIVTPFLHDEIGTTISYGGTVSLFVSIGMASSACIAGWLIQRKSFHSFTLMAIGSFVTAIGLLLAFPPPYIPALYNNAKWLSILGVFIAGFGDPLVTLPTLRAMCDLQEARTGPLSASTVTIVTSIWLMFYHGAYYAGSFLAGLMTDYLSFSETAQVLAAGCMIAFGFSVYMRLFVKIDQPADPVSQERLKMSGLESE